VLLGRLSCKNDGPDAEQRGAGAAELLNEPDAEQRGVDGAAELYEPDAEQQRGVAGAAEL